MVLASLPIRESVPAAQSIRRMSASVYTSLFSGDESSVPGLALREAKDEQTPAPAPMPAAANNKLENEIAGGSSGAKIGSMVNNSSTVQFFTSFETISLRHTASLPPLATAWPSIYKNGAAQHDFSCQRRLP